MADTRLTPRGVGRERSQIQIEMKMAEKEEKREDITSLNATCLPTLYPLLQGHLYIYNIYYMFPFSSDRDTIGLEFPEKVIITMQ